MAIKFKDSGYLLPLILALLIALVAVIFIGVAFIGRGIQHQRTVTVTAVGTASANPSMAKIDVLINATGKTAGLANTNLSAIVNSFNSTILPFLNGNMSLIQTLYYEIYQATNCTYINTYYCTPTKLGYYVATESIEVTVPSINNVSAVIAGVSGINGLQLQDVQAQLSESQQTTLGREALSQALDNATIQAGILAANGTKIRVENITVEYSRIYYPYALSGSSGVQQPTVLHSMGEHFRRERRVCRI